MDYSMLKKFLGRLNKQVLQFYNIGMDTDAIFCTVIFFNLYMDQFEWNFKVQLMLVGDDDVDELIFFHSYECFLIKI